MANGHSEQHFPVWAQVVLRVGVYPSITLLLMWWFTTHMARTIDDMAMSMQSHAQTTIEIKKVLEDNEQQRDTRDKEIINILRQECVNAAEGHKMIDSCFNPVQVPYR